MFIVYYETSSLTKDQTSTEIVSIKAILYSNFLLLIPVVNLSLARLCQQVPRECLTRGDISVISQN